MSVLILCGKSGSGKDYLQRKLIGNGFNSIVSHTSRPMRNGEENGSDYWFVSKEEFLNKIENGDFLEYRSYNTKYNGVEDIWYYGIAKDSLKMSDNNVVVLDLNGAKKFVECLGKENCTVVYVNCPNEVRKERAKLRGSFDETEWNRRLKADEEDFSEDKRKEIVDFTYNNYKGEQK